MSRHSENGPNSWRKVWKFARDTEPPLENGSTRTQRVSQKHHQCPAARQRGDYRHAGVAIGGRTEVHSRQAASSRSNSVFVNWIPKWFCIASSKSVQLIWCAWVQTVSAVALAADCTAQHLLEVHPPEQRCLWIPNKILHSQLNSRWRVGAVGRYGRWRQALRTPFALPEFDAALRVVWRLARPFKAVDIHSHVDAIP